MTIIAVKKDRDRMRAASRLTEQSVEHGLGEVVEIASSGGKHQELDMDFRWADIGGERRWKLGSNLQGDLFAPHAFVRRIRPRTWAALNVENDLPILFHCPGPYTPRRPGLRSVIKNVIRIGSGTVRNPWERF